VFTWFFISLCCMMLTLPFHWLSVEHIKLENKFGKEKGRRIGELLGLFSGWIFFISWIGIWVSPQPRFYFYISNISFIIPFLGIKTTLLHIIIASIFVSIGAWLGISGVKEVTLKVAETHRPEKIVTSGVYSIIRHPQYFGGLLAHIGISFLLSAFYALISTPLIIVVIYIMSLKEEIELIREFGEAYIAYRKQVPMLFPTIKRKKYSNSN